jgi:hypothetical protein
MSDDNFDTDWVPPSGGSGTIPADTILGNNTTTEAPPIAQTLADTYITVVAPAANATQMTAGRKILGSIIKTFADNLAYLFARHMYEHNIVYDYRNSTSGNITNASCAFKITTNSNAVLNTLAKVVTALKAMSVTNVLAVPASGMYGYTTDGMRLVYSAWIATDDELLHGSSYNVSLMSPTTVSFPNEGTGTITVKDKVVQLF